MTVDTISSTTGASYTQQTYAGQIRTPQTQTTQGNEAETQGSTASVQAGDQVQLKHVTAATKNLDTVRAIEQMHARLNELAKGARETNEGLAKAAEKINQMQTLAKNFPPFSVDSSQRQEILMSYVSLKKEIEQLMVPPPPKPLYESVKHMWDSLFGENGQILSSAVPKLETTSSDQQVKDAGVRLGKNSEQLANISNNITNTLVKGP